MTLVLLILVLLISLKLKLLFEFCSDVSHCVFSFDLLSIFFKVKEKNIKKTKTTEVLLSMATTMIIIFSFL